MHYLSAFYLTFSFFFSVNRAALEWRIREDVPTNLRAVKSAAMEVGYDGVMKSKFGGMQTAPTQADESSQEAEFADFILDYENETLGAYLQ